MTTHAPDLDPFTIHVPDEDLTDLRDRLGRLRWPDEDPDAGWSQGLPLAYARELARWWRDEFDWRSVEARLNDVAQLSTRIDGHDLHCFHLTSGDPAAVPVVLLHGWPGSSAELLPMAEALLDSDGPVAFDVVVPTVPGFGVSGPAVGWDVTRAARALAELMRRLGCSSYVVHGYDTGAAIARAMGDVDPDHVLLVHATQVLGGPGLTEDDADMDDPVERQAVIDGQRYAYDLGAYAMLQATRPQSIAYGCTDSPVGLLAWLVERYRDWSAATDLPEEVLSRESMLTTVSIYWFFRTLGSSARYYREGLANWGEPLTPTTAPTAICVMPDDIGRPVRRLVEPSTPIVRWQQLSRGGHFAGWEQPRLVAEDLAAAYRQVLVA